MPRVPALCLVLPLALAVLEAGPSADTALRLDLPGLVARSEWILEGRVQRVSAREEPNGLITTEVEVAVARTFLGEHRAVRTFRVPGGLLPDGRGLLLPGLPRWETGEDVVMFLTRPGRTGLRVTVGGAQGAYFLARDVQGEVEVSRRMGSLRRVEPSSGAVIPEPGAEPYRDWASRLEAAVAVERERRARAEASGPDRTARRREEAVDR